MSARAFLSKPINPACNASVIQPHKTLLMLLGGEHTGG
jgi:hypothetical protein